MELKLSNERFDEILKLITENPKKALKTVKKEELFDFISDLQLKSFDASSALEEKNAECERLCGVVTTLSKERDLAMKQVKVKEKSCNDLQEEIQELKSQLIVADDNSDYQCKNYEKMIKTLTIYRFVTVILAVIVVLQWIF